MNKFVIKKNGQCRYKYIALGRVKSYSVTKQISESDFITMLECNIDKICAMFGRRVFEQTVFILMDTNCAPLLIELNLKDTTDTARSASYLDIHHESDNP